MKIKPYHLVLVVIFLILGVLFFSTGTMDDLFSRSVNLADEKNTEGEEPRPVVQSLDTLSDEPSDNLDKRIEGLQQELLEAENDPDKAIELRRRIQLLKAQKQDSSSPTESEI